MELTQVVGLQPDPHLAPALGSEITDPVRHVEQRFRGQPRTGHRTLRDAAFDLRRLNHVVITRSERLDSREKNEVFPAGKARWLLERIDGAEVTLPRLSSELSPATVSRQ